jgi:beta-lactamase class C
MFTRLSTVFSLLFVLPNLHADSLNDFNQQYSIEVAATLAQKNIPGGAYSIVKGDQIVALETFGYSDKNQTKKITPDTIFRLASVSKTFTGNLTTLLAEEKKLDLSLPIRHYVPHFTLATKGAADNIKLKHLISHSSGLMPNAYDNLLHENWNIDKIISRFDRVAPICEPGQCYGYQNIAFSLIQPAIEHSQNKSFSALLQEHFFSPLQMHHASVGIDKFLASNNSAKPHVLVKRTNTGKKDSQGNSIKKYIWRTVKVQDDFYKVPAAAGINASITDLTKWLIANLGYQPEVLPPELLATVTTPRIRTKKDLQRKFWRNNLTDAHYGYGWRIYQFDNIPIIYHSGWVAGFRADIGYAPTLDIGFAMLINAESNVINQLSHQFWLQMTQTSLAKK